MKILLLEDDSKTISQITEMLSGFEVVFEAKSEKFLERISQAKPDVILIDFDLKVKDGLMVYREIRHAFPHAKTIMFSASNSIPLAVMATKLGVLDFLRKPFPAETLREAVAKALKKEEPQALDLSGIKNSEWLAGISSEIKNTIGEIKMHSQAAKDLAIFSEIGIDRKTAAQIIHNNGIDPDKRFIDINFASFAGSASESNVFLTLKELFSVSEAETVRDKKDLPGTVFLDGLEIIPGSFRESLLQFIREKKSPVRVFFGTQDERIAQPFTILRLPQLKERREDIPIIALEYLKRYAPEVKYLSPEVLEFLMYYDFPGNYAELENLIAISSSSFPGAEVLNIKSFSLDARALSSVARNKAFSKEKYDLKDVRAEFENVWFKAVLEKVNGDIHAAARFFDMPRTVLSERLKALGLR